MNWANKFGLMDTNLSLAVKWTVFESSVSPDLTLYHLLRLKICRSTFLNYIKFVDRRILRPYRNVQSASLHAIQRAFSLQKTYIIWNSTHCTYFKRFQGLLESKSQNYRNPVATRVSNLIQDPQKKLRLRALKSRETFVNRFVDSDLTKSSVGQLRTSTNCSWGIQRTYCTPHKNTGV